jgi:hypothetical protein
MLGIEDKLRYPLFKKTCKYLTTLLMGLTEAIFHFLNMKKLFFKI